MESLGLLAGGVAHDINNVLGAILALATVHQRKAEAGTPLFKGMETIAKACLRGGSLVKSLLGFARKDLHEERQMNLNDLVREEFILLERATLQKIALRGDLDDRLWDLQGDPAALSHAIMNLCVNALDAMPEGGTLRIRTRNEEPHSVVLEIEDTGMGMAPEVLQQAMVPFYTTKPLGSGTGLGLSIVYGTIRAHRGTIELLSEPGRGTLVRMRFPTTDSILVDESEPGKAKGAGGSDGKHILFVDDDPLILESFPGMIECLGHSATAVSSGEQALALIEQGFRPDLVILDVNMPGLGGLETLVRLRQQTLTLPVLLSTGFPSQAVLEVAKNHPGVHLISKPFTMDELKRQIEVATP